MRGKKQAEAGTQVEMTNFASQADAPLSISDMPDLRTPGRSSKAGFGVCAFFLNDLNGSIAHIYTVAQMCRGGRSGTYLSRNGGKCR